MKYIFSLFLLSVISLSHAMEDSLTVRTINLKTEALADFVISELADHEFRIDAMENEKAADRAKKNLLLAAPRAQSRIQAAIESGVQQFQLRQEFIILQQQAATNRDLHARTSAAQNAQINALQSSNTWLKWITCGAIAVGGAAWIWNFVRSVQAEKSIADLKSQVSSGNNNNALQPLQPTHKCNNALQPPQPTSHKCSNEELEQRINKKLETQQNNLDKKVAETKKQLDQKIAEAQKQLDQKILKLAAEQAEIEKQIEEVVKRGHVTVDPDDRFNLIAPKPDGVWQKSRVKTGAIHDSKNIPNPNQA